jgi:N-acetylglutamate synthase-like GNAT family acetyltransferase
VGRLLMERVFGTAREAGVQRMECLSTLTAVPFYRALGFLEVGPVTVPLAPGIDFPAVAMWREL